MGCVHNAPQINRVSNEGCQMWAGQVSSPVRLERKEKKDGCKKRERRGNVSPVICVASGDLVVTLVSVPQQTTTLFFRARIGFCKRTIFI